MAWRLPLPSLSRATPAPAGPRGRILFVGPFNGGVGGMERLTRIFAEWAEGSGFGATMVFRHVFPPGPYSVTPSPHVAILRERQWSRALERVDWDFVYVMPSGLRWRRWVPRLARLGGVRVVLDLDKARHFLDACDVLHCETPRDEPRPVPCVVAPPDPRSTIPAVPARPTERFTLTVFTPYGNVKGHAHVRPFLEGSGRDLVWCYDPVSFARRKRRHGREIEARVAALAHPRLRTVRAPSLETLYGLYAAADSYACFSERESFGFAIADAVALGKPLCARRVGACRLLEGFQATEDFARPVFGRYALPRMPGYEHLFAQAARIGRRRTGDA
jgi:hypothetical protein